LIIRKTFGIQIRRLLVFTTIAVCIGIPLAEAQGGSSNKIDLTSEERQWLEEHKDNIKYAPSTNYPPIGFVENGEYKGMTADYLRVIEKRLNISFNMVYCETWNELMEKARAGKVDMVGNIQNTPERRKFLRLTSPYVRIPNSIIVKKDLKGTLSSSQMDGMKVAIVKGYSSLGYVKTKHPGMIIVPVRDNPAGLQMVSFGRADAMITDLAVASYFIESLGITNLRVAGSIDYVWDLCFASRKDWPQLNRIIEKALNTISEPERLEIKDKWISLTERGWRPGPQFWITLSGAIMLLVIIGLFFWNLTLRRQVRVRTTDLQTELMERRHAEEELRESEERYRSLVESTEDSIYLVDRDCRYLFMNKKHLSRFGLTLDEITGRSYSEFHSKKETNEFARKVNEVLKTGKSLSYEYGSERDGGYYIRTLSSVKRPDGTMTAVTVDSKDITARKQAEEKIKQSLKEKELLLQETHHRVKNNMQVISSMLSLQSQHITDKASLEMFQESQSRIRAMALIHEKLYTSEDPSHIDIASYIHSLTHQLITTYRTTASRVNMDIAITDIFLTITTAIPCGLIINELVTNALKHAFPHQRDGTITVSMTPSNTDSLILTVSDTGIGFPEGIDFRNTTTLGMQLVTSLVEQLEGTITLDRSEGTRFRIEFRTQE